MSHLIGSDDDPRWVDFIQGGGEYWHGKDTYCDQCKRTIVSGTFVCDHLRGATIEQGRRFVENNPPRS